jgi:hypothetical protein
MVVSLLDNKIRYTEKLSLDPLDQDYETDIVYEYTLNETIFEFVLGQREQKRNVYYYSIYVIVGDEPKARIGVFEIKSEKLLSSINEEGELDLAGGNLLFFVKEDYIKNLYKNYKLDDEETPHENDDDDEETPHENDDDDVFRLNIPIDKKEQETKETLFQEIPNFIHPHKLPEESKTDADSYKRDYIESSKNEWIQKFMKNNQYSIVDNEGGGDCFFAVIRDAFEQVGKRVSVEKMRKMLAKKVKDDNYQHYKELYEMLNSEYQNILHELNVKKKDIAVLKKQCDKKIVS